MGDQGENRARSDTEPRRGGGVGVQQNGGADLRQLAHPRSSQLKDVQRLQDPPRLHPPDLLVGSGTALRQDTRPPAARRTFRSTRSPSQLCKRLGLEIQPTKRGLLPLLARSAPQTSGEMRIIAPTAPHRLISFRTFLPETELLAFTICNRWTQRERCGEAAKKLYFCITPQPRCPPVQFGNDVTLCNLTRTSPTPFSRAFPTSERINANTIIMFETLLRVIGL